MNATVERFRGIAWLANIGQPADGARTFGSLEKIIAEIESDADAFFNIPYTDPYQASCVEDHHAAERLRTPDMAGPLREISKAAYLAAWERLPIPELCGLVSDDAETILTLLMSGVPLRPFTIERMRWYELGRAPWGYEGEFPQGTWRVL